jgi:two-component system, OmpR family, sensor histidine kinase BaeS
MFPTLGQNSPRSRVQAGGTLMTRLRTRLALSHIVLAAGALLLAGFLSTTALRGRFDQYVAASIDSRVDDLARTVVSARYGDGTWNMAVLEKHGVAALEDGFLLTLLAGDGSMVWDARSHNAGLCAAMVSSMAERMAGLGRDNPGSYSERTIQLGSSQAGLIPDDKDPDYHGLLIVGYWGPVYYRDADMDFIAALNGALLATGAMVVVVAALAGIAGAAGLAAPVRSAASVARAVAAGDYSLLVKASGIVELDELGASLGNMAKVLADQDDLRKRLVIDASHEIRTPLAALRARLEAVIDGVYPADARLIEGCLVDVGRLTELASGLEGLAGVEVAANSPDFSLLDLGQLAGTAVDSCSASACGSGLVIELYCTEPVMVNADRTLVLKVVENLLNNALRYGAPGNSADTSSVVTRSRDSLHGKGTPVVKCGIIRIEVGMQGEQAVLSVIDYGMGMENRHLGRIFERFYRVDPSRSRSTGGFGVGLAIARAAARACGGDVVAFSDGLGKGSRFEFRLPGVLHRPAFLS